MNNFIIKLVDIFVWLNLMIFLVLLGQNTIRNLWERYSEKRSAYFEKQISEAISENNLMKIASLKIKRPGDMYIVAKLAVTMLDFIAGDIKKALLQCLKNNGYTQKLIRELDCLTAKRRFAAIELLGKIGCTEAAAVIKKQLKHQNTYMQAAALRALAHLQEKETLPAVIKAVQNTKDLTVLASVLCLENKVDNFIEEICAKKKVNANIFLLAAERRIVNIA